MQGQVLYTLKICNELGMLQPLDFGNREKREAGIYHK